MPIIDTYRRRRQATSRSNRNFNLTHCKRAHICRVVVFCARKFRSLARLPVKVEADCRRQSIMRLARDNRIARGRHSHTHVAYPAIVCASKHLSGQRLEGPLEQVARSAAAAAACEPRQLCVCSFVCLSTHTHTHSASGRKVGARNTNSRCAGERRLHCSCLIVVEFVAHYSSHASCEQRVHSQRNATMMLIIIMRALTSIERKDFRLL